MLFVVIILIAIAGVVGWLFFSSRAKLRGNMITKAPTGIVNQNTNQPQPGTTPPTSEMPTIPTAETPVPNDPQPPIPPVPPTTPPIA